MKALVPSLFPSVGYMAYWLTGEYGWNVEAKYEKRSFRNRYRIAGPNGKQDLTAQINHQSDKSSFKNVELDHSMNWAEKEWRSIETAYRNASFFEALAPELESIISTQHHTLLERCEVSMQWLLNHLNTDTHIPRSSEIPSIPHVVSPNWKYPIATYRQVFLLKNGFSPFVSTLDLLMNEGPLAYDILEKQLEIILDPTDHFSD